MRCDIKSQSGRHGVGLRAQLGINGFGRIGRLVMRAVLTRKDATVVAINEPFMDVNVMEYLFKYDTVHGRYKGTVAVEDGTCARMGTVKVRAMARGASCENRFVVCAGKLVVDGVAIQVFTEKDPKSIPWGSLDVDVVCEVRAWMREVFFVWVLGGVS
jgi:glyceraldehyde 3-phosphate dehydrogenase